MAERNADLVHKLTTRTATVAVIGLGYVGLPLAVQHAKAGYTVLGVDIDDRRVARLNAGVCENTDVPEVDLKEVVKQGRLRATSSFEGLAECDVITICVPTPLGPHKDPDVSYIESVLRSSGPYLRAGQLMILESTTYPGTTEEILLPAIVARGLTPGANFHLVFSPERIDPGNSRFRLADIPKVVGGATPSCTEAARLLYETSLGKQVHTVSSPRAAEMTKLLENIYRIVNVSLVNELALLCERMDVDIWEVIDAAKTKPFGFMPFYPGPGMGGHCIPVDAFYLSWKAKEHGFTTHFIELAGTINDGMPAHVVTRCAEVLNSVAKPVQGAKILIVGVAYKRDVPDTRESPAVRVAELLLARGARLSYHDPHVPSLRLADDDVLQSCELTDEALRHADLVLVLTDHSRVDFRRIATNARLVYDTRNAVPTGSVATVVRLGASQGYSG